MKTRCNNCETVFESDEELIIFLDDNGHGKGCPKCKTDAYLMDLEEYEGNVKMDKNKIIEVLEKVVDRDGGTDYGDENTHDVRACCRVLSWKDHESDCYILEVKELLEELKKDEFNI